MREGESQRRLSSNAGLEERAVGAHQPVLIGKFAERADGVGQGEHGGVGGRRQQDPHQQIGFLRRDLAAIGGLVHGHAKAAGREVFPVAALARPGDDGIGVLHGLVEQLIHRAHRRPHHVAEGVHVLAPLLRQADQIRQHLVDKRLCDVGDRIDGLAAARAQSVDDAPGVAAKCLRHMRQRARRKRIRHHRTHAAVLGRIVGEQQFRAHRIRVVPGARGGREALPILEARDHMLESRQHGDVFPRQPDDGRQLAQPIVHRAGIAHRFARERVGVEFRNRLRHGLTPRRQCRRRHAEFRR